MHSIYSALDPQTPIAGIDAAGDIDATEAALDLLCAIQAEHGPVSIHHHGGMTNGGDVMCLPNGELRTGDNDVLLGSIEGAPVYVSSRSLKDWDNRQFILDAIVGGGGSFSLDSGTGRRFFVRNRAF